MFMPENIDLDTGEVTELVGSRTAKWPSHSPTVKANTREATCFLIPGISSASIV